LIESAWPGLSIEESNLTVQIAALRRTFAEEPGGENWIETLSRRGYRYIGPAVAHERPSGRAVIIGRRSPSKRLSQIAPLERSAQSPALEASLTLCVASSAYVPSKAESDRNADTARPIRRNHESQRLPPDCLTPTGETLGPAPFLAHSSGRSVHQIPKGLVLGFGPIVELPISIAVFRPPRHRPFGIRKHPKRHDVDGRDQQHQSEPSAIAGAVRTALEAFCRLRGVQVRVASAILTAMHPEQFTVIDQKAYLALGRRLKPDIPEYLRYLAFCRGETHRLDVTLREHDQALWQRGDDLARRQRKSYKPSL